MLQVSVRGVSIGLLRIQIMLHMVMSAMLFIWVAVLQMYDGHIRDMVSMSVRLKIINVSDENKEYYTAAVDGFADSLFREHRE
jgi:hypothetical protein